MSEMTDLPVIFQKAKYWKQKYRHFISMLRDGAVDNDLRNKTKFLIR